MQLTVKICEKKPHNSKNLLKMEELIKTPKNFCNIVGAMSPC